MLWSIFDLEDLEGTSIFSIAWPFTFIFGSFHSHIFGQGRVGRINTHFIFYQHVSLTKELQPFLSKKKLQYTQIHTTGTDGHETFLVDDVVMEVYNESQDKTHYLTLSHFWPVRRPRPITEKVREIL